MEVLELHLQSLGLLQLMLAVVAVFVVQEHREQVELAEGAQVEQAQEILQPQTLAAEAAVHILVKEPLEVLAAQVLSFFATPAQFNISLVAQ
jgi:hypothetical protein